MSIRLHIVLTCMQFFVGYNVLRLCLQGRNKTTVNNRAILYVSLSRLCTQDTSTL